MFWNFPRGGGSGSKVVVVINTLYLLLHVTMHYMICIYPLLGAHTNLFSL